ncbi:acyl-CoA desaturase [Amnibacterium sp. CER49]|uniref:fatty acid desaturase family protein n=1 Tax=Amnibacterium sp. CER49 TaxID=3039161 RepID=UPI00244BC334|nr:acyl-CoA desaturase [Amnibacterium sp. CER49]MDH2444035.1 acyl-CoA desaturase [Amnibacterium sp. CER49]
MTTTVDAPGVRTTRPRTRPVGEARSLHASDYTALAKQVKEAGLLRRRPGSYLTRGIVLTALLAGGFVLLATLGRTWWQLLVAVYFAVVFTQIAFLAHDSAHKQIFTSGRVGEAFSRIIGNLGIGLSYGWWMNKHSRHHANPNTIGRDDDIVPGAIVFVTEEAPKRRGLRRWLTAHQGWYFVPILALSGLDLHINAVKAIVTGEHVEHRFTEAALIAIRLLGFPLVVVLLLGPGLGAAFMAVQLAAFGLYMGGTFSLNHTGMRVIERGEKVDYFRRQVLTSRNISGGRLMEHVMGGLNLQIEHHLFPNMPSANLRRVRPLVRQHCLDLGVPYEENDVLTAGGIVIRHLHRVGIRAADPFDCPAAQAFRTA